MNIKTKLNIGDTFYVPSWSGSKPFMSKHIVDNICMEANAEEVNTTYGTECREQHIEKNCYLTILDAKQALIEEQNKDHKRVMDMIEEASKL